MTEAAVPALLGSHLHAGSKIWDSKGGLWSPLERSYLKAGHDEVYSFFRSEDFEEAITGQQNKPVRRSAGLTVTLGPARYHSQPLYILQRLESLKWEVLRQIQLSGAGTGVTVQ